MKKVCFVMMMLITVSSFAQQKEERRKPMKERAGMNMTAEEKAILKSKKLTLDLDLTEAQQKEFQKLYVDRAKKIQEKKEEMKGAAEDGKLKEQAFERINEHLDAQIAFQQSIQKVLSKDQYELWKRVQRTKQRDRSFAFNKRSDQWRAKHKNPK